MSILCGKSELAERVLSRATAEPVDGSAPIQCSRYSSWARTDCSAAGHKLRSTSAYTRATISLGVRSPAASAART